MFKSFQLAANYQEMWNCQVLTLHILQHEFQPAQL